ncbi:hypothetical protein ACIBL5_37800 [Streptomyces sp. NPDC050516]|uniref:hypothetical protein n=1 Tax=Streptomyces sp. NPDC050516 TaxID=3365621 RepID=UPI0037B01669
MAVLGDVAGGEQVVVRPAAVADEDGFLLGVEVAVRVAVVQPEVVAFLDQEVGEGGQVPVSDRAVAGEVGGAVDVADGQDLVGVLEVVVALSWTARSRRWWR